MPLNRQYFSIMCDGYDIWRILPVLEILILPVTVSTENLRMIIITWRLYGEMPAVTMTCFLLPG